jgi:hypothetical protein
LKSIVPLKTLSSSGASPKIPTFVTTVISWIKMTSSPFEFAWYLTSLRLLSSFKELYVIFEFQMSYFSLTEQLNLPFWKMQRFCLIVFVYSPCHVVSLGGR